MPFSVEEQKAMWRGRFRNDPQEPLMRFHHAERMLSNNDQALGEVDAIFGCWAVTKDGLECLTSPYFIEKSRLKEHDWHQHLEGKTWMYPYMPDFENAFEFALTSKAKRKSAYKLKVYKMIYEAEELGFLHLTSRSLTFREYPHYLHCRRLGFWGDRSDADYHITLDTSTPTASIYLHYGLGKTFQSYEDADNLVLQFCRRWRCDKYCLSPPNRHGNDGMNSVRVRGSDAIQFARSLAEECKRLQQTPKTTKEINQMIKLFKDGKAIALQTDANDERQFTRQFALALQDYLTTPESTSPEQLEKVLTGYVEITCKLRGYKADVREQRIITSGDVAPSDAAVIVSTDETVPKAISKEA